jgi:3,4-dihydroxy 2-butanone 4-phosphate synthase/GTP cyclohydrolase II
MMLYTSDRDEKEHLAMVMGDPRDQSSVLTRVHSECFTGDVIGSRRCDCGDQMQVSLEIISARGQGVLLYLRQEGRGIGLLEKLRAYNLQDEGFDTIDANLALGHQADARDYSIAAEMLKDIGVRSIQLLTNNPTKISALRRLGIDVAGRMPLDLEVHPDSAHYLQTKADRMNHMLNPERLKAAWPERMANGHGPIHRRD